jgi:hypothetical protein
VYAVVSCDYSTTWQQGKLGDGKLG